MWFSSDELSAHRRLAYPFISRLLPSFRKIRPGRILFREPFDALRCQTLKQAQETVQVRNHLQHRMFRFSEKVRYNQRWHISPEEQQS